MTESPGQLIPIGAIDNGFRSVQKQVVPFNLGIFGVTGVGKSTLLNVVFGEELADTGIGEPVTQGSQLYRSGTSRIGVFDTKGLEIGSDSKEILRGLTQFVVANRLGRLEEQIHVVWYCIRAGSRRIQPAEVVFIQQLAKLDMPVILVMTQTPKTLTGAIHSDAQALAAELDAAALPVIGRVHFINALGDNFAGFDPFGLAELLDSTSAVAPEAVRTALAIAQRVSRRQKETQAAALITAAERRMAGKVFLGPVGEVWAELFAGIAAIYGIGEDEARSILDEARSATRLRHMLQVTGGGIIVLMAAPVPGGLASAILLRAGLASSLLANKLQKKLREADAVGVPIAWDTAEDEVPIAEKQRISTGFAAGQVTRAIGEAWLHTCDTFWTSAFPGSVHGQSHEMAEHFANDLYERLPRHIRVWEDRARRRVATQKG